MDTQQTLKPYVIGLDLGGTNSVFGIVDSRGEIKATTAIKTQGYDKVEDYVDACVTALEPIIEQVGGIDMIKAMGIGAPNGNYYNGTIEFAPNLSWGHDGIVPLAAMFKERLGIPVALTNDANAAAIGEMIYGVARGMKNFIVITLGTGVGSSSTVSSSMAATALLVSLDTSSYAARMVVLADVVVRVASRPIARQRAWHVRPVNCWQLPLSLLCSVSSIPRRSQVSMLLLLLVKATSWPTRSMSSPDVCWVRPVPTLPLSRRLRPSSSSEV